MAAQRPRDRTPQAFGVEAIKQANGSSGAEGDASDKPNHAAGDSVQKKKGRSISNTTMEVLR